MPFAPSYRLRNLVDETRAQFTPKRVSALVQSILHLIISDRGWSRLPWEGSLANIKQQWFEEHVVRVMEWPAHFPDLNTAELAWNMLKMKRFRLNPGLVDMGHSKPAWEYFRGSICEAWDPLDQSKIDSLILSMPRRIDAVRGARAAIPSISAAK